MMAMNEEWENFTEASLIISLHECVCLTLFADAPAPPPPPTVNLTGKAFTFGAENADSYVKLSHNLSKALDVTSVCFRYFSDIPTSGREQTFFSLATPSHSNGFLVGKKGLNRHQLYIGSTKEDFWGLPDELGRWNSMCATWESGPGLAQVWLNGKSSPRKSLFKGRRLAGVPVMVLGQDQDRYGGGFNKNDALVGQLTDVHMWDRVISPCEIKQFAENKLQDGGNIINWQALSYSTHGDVTEEGNITGSGSQGCAE